MQDRMYHPLCEVYVTFRPHSRIHHPIKLIRHLALTEASLLLDTVQRRYHLHRYHVVALPVRWLAIRLCVRHYSGTTISKGLQGLRVLCRRPHPPQAWKGQTWCELYSAPAIGLYLAGAWVRAQLERASGIDLAGITHAVRGNGMQIIACSLTAGPIRMSPMEGVLPIPCRTVLLRCLQPRWRQNSIWHWQPCERVRLGMCARLCIRPHPPHAWKIKSGCEVQPAPGNGLLYLGGA